MSSNLIMWCSRGRGSSMMGLVRLKNMITFVCGTASVLDRFTVFLCVSACVDARSVCVSLPRYSTTAAACCHTTSIDIDDRRT